MSANPTLLSGSRDAGILSLREKLNGARQEPAAAGRPPTVAAGNSYKALKGTIHLKLLEKFDLGALDTLAPDVLRQEIATMVERLLDEEQAAVNETERSTMIRDIQHEMLGFGPLELLMADPAVSDILVNSYRQIYVERHGRLELSHVSFTDEKHLLRIMDKIVSLVGRRIDESSPMVDARLPDGSRVNAVIPPVAIDGPMMSIRRFAHIPLKMENLVSDSLKTLTPEMAELLRGLIHSKVNILISAAPAPARPPCSTSCRGTSRSRNGSSRSRTPPSCRCSSRTWCAWRRGRPTSKGEARSRSGRWCATRCGCGPTGS